MAYMKGDRIRLYIYEIGDIYGTVVQDHSVTYEIGPVLVHIDGTSEFDYRWVNKKLIHSEMYSGQYAITK